MDSYLFYIKICIRKEHHQELYQVQGKQHVTQGVRILIAIN